LHWKNDPVEKLKDWVQELAEKHQQFIKADLKLDLTRGKPALEQLALADALDGILHSNYIASDGTDVRNYGGLKGLPEVRNLGAEWLSLPKEEVIVSGNSSLSLMYQVLHVGAHYGYGTTPWLEQSKPPEFLAIVPGYDRHFGICEKLGIKMINIPMKADGPDMEMIEIQVRRPQVKGIFCVPKYSNPTGNIYSAEVVGRIARLGNQAASDFRIMWDNAYAVHDHHPNVPELTNLMELCRLHDTQDSVFMFGSTSKVTFAGAGISFLGGSKANLEYFLEQMACWTIGPDKVNQLRHARLLPDLAATKKHMQQHAGVIRPKFELVFKKLEETFTGQEMGTWIHSQGGYFISFDSLPGLAKEIIRLSGEAGVKMTPAGSTFPYGVDPEDKNIRLSPTFPPIENLSMAMDVFVNCVQLATVKRHLSE
jgi:DNA-binding transcriptional MocR family regulator